MWEFFNSFSKKCHKRVRISCKVVLKDNFACRTHFWHLEGHRTTLFQLLRPFFPILTSIFRWHNGQRPKFRHKNLWKVPKSQAMRRKLSETVVSVGTSNSESFTPFATLVGAYEKTQAKITGHLGKIIKIGGLIFEKSHQKIVRWRDFDNILDGCQQPYNLSIATVYSTYKCYLCSYALFLFGIYIFFTPKNSWMYLVMVVQIFLKSEFRKNENFQFFLKYAYYLISEDTSVTAEFRRICQKVSFLV